MSSNNGIISRNLSSIDDNPLVCDWQGKCRKFSHELTFQKLFDEHSKFQKYKEWNQIAKFRMKTEKHREPSANNVGILALAT